MAVRSLWRQDQSYSAQDDRLVIQALTPYMEEGIVRGSHLKVAQRAAGVNMSVDVASGFAIIDGDDTASQGFYVVYNDSVANRTISAPSANPRRDLVVARVQDAAEAGAVNAVNVEVIQGTPAVSNPLDPALPNNAIPLASVLVNPGAVSITNADVTDRRTLSGAARAPRGEIGYAERVTDLAVDTVDRDVVSVTITGLTAGRRLEISGQVYQISGSGGVAWLHLDRAAVQLNSVLFDVAGAGGQFGMPVLARDVVPADGDYTFTMRVSASSGTGTLSSSQSYGRAFIRVVDVGGGLV